jgi:tetratricopeptide (TPR) repeat protein
MAPPFRPATAATQRFYNPDWLGDDDLVAGFVARRELFELLRQDLARAPLRGSVQHTLLVGPRGSGKTTLLKRLAVAIRRDADLGDHLIALSFQEELYQLKSLADFWWAACETLSDEFDRAGQPAAAQRLDAAIDRAKSSAGPGSDPVDTAGLTLLLQTCEALRRRPVLLVDNVDMIMQRIDTKGRKRKDPLSPAYWALREALSTATSPIMIGGSMRVSEAFVGYDKAFYDFFAARRLTKLSLEEVEEVLARLAEINGTPDWEGRMRTRRGRIRALYEMTGGNPRALGLIFDLLRQGLNSRAIDDFERLLDITTPYYKARMEDLSEQAQVIMHALAQLRRRVTAAEIARQAGLETRTVSAQLDLLINEGVVEKFPGKGKTRYIIAEQLFRIWIQMRSSRRLRQRVLYLTEFLEALFNRKDVDALLAADGERASSGWRQAGAMRDFALGEWQGDTPLGRALKARAADALLDSAEGPLPAYGPGDFAPELEEVAKCLCELRRQQLGSLNPRHLLGSVSMTLHERRASVARLCDPATVAAELSLLKPQLAEERRALRQDGLADADIDLLYDLRSRGLLPLPVLTADDVEAVVKTRHCPELFNIAWILLGASRITVATVADAQRWLAFGRSHLEKASSEAWADAADTLRRHKYYDAAIQAVDDAFQRGECTRAWRQRGILLDAYQDRPTEAAAAFRRAIGLNPSDASSWRCLGIVSFRSLECFQEAAAAFHKAIALDPTHTLPWNELGRLFAHHLERFGEAESVFRTAIALEPSDAYSWNELGRLFAHRLERFDEAESTFRTAIALDPTNAIPWTQLGWLFARHLERFDEAESAFRTAIDLDPTLSPSWNCLGWLLAYVLGRFDEAEVAVRRGLVSNPHDNWSRRILNRLRHQRLLAPVTAAVAAENWGIVREHLERWIGDAEIGPELWASDILIDKLVGGALRLGRGETLLRLLYEVGLDRLAAPLVQALEAALAGSAEGLANIEPEARTAAESIYERLMAIASSPTDGTPAG